MRNLVLVVWLLGWPLVAHFIFQDVSNEAATGAAWISLSWYLIFAVLLYEEKKR